MNKWTTSLGTSLIDFSYMSLKTIAKIYQQGTLDKHSSDFYLLLGDLHGNIKAALILAIRLQTLFQVRLKAIFQVGDFGFWPTGTAAKLLDPHYPISLTQNAIAKARSFTVYMFDPGVSSLL